MHAVAQEMTTIEKVQPQKRETRDFVVVAYGRQQGRNVPVLVFMAAISGAYPQNYKKNTLKPPKTSKKHQKTHTKNTIDLGNTVLATKVCLC